SIINCGKAAWKKVVPCHMLPRRKASGCIHKCGDRTARDQLAWSVQLLALSIAMLLISAKKTPTSTCTRVHVYAFNLSV
ncbi:unnamed protein product, partial [Dovyalis caffra]